MMLQDDAVISCLGNSIGQSHLGIKQRYYPTLGLASFESVKRFCQAYDQAHQFFLPRQRMAEYMSLVGNHSNVLSQS